MEAHRGLFHLFLLLLVLLLNSKAALSTTKLSCFSVGLLDLPTFGFNQEEKEAEEKSEEEGDGRQVTSSFDACFWGLLSFVVFSVVPAGLKSEVARVQERINAALPSPLASSPLEFPDYPQELDDGNRRLDLNVYNYVDTSGPSNDISNSPPPSLFTPPPPPGYPPPRSSGYPQPSSSGIPPSSNSVYEFVHQSSYGMGQAPAYSRPAYQQASYGVQQAIQTSEAQAGWPHVSHQQVGNSQQAYSAASPVYSPPISSSLLQDDWEGKLMVGNSDSSDQLAKLPIEQDYDDIDYTSGGLVTFHTSLSKK